MGIGTTIGPIGTGITGMGIPNGPGMPGHVQGVPGIGIGMIGGKSALPGGPIQPPGLFVLPGSVSRDGS